jgi:hypothetical protein
LACSCPSCSACTLRASPRSSSSTSAGRRTAWHPRRTRTRTRARARARARTLSLSRTRARTRTRARSPSRRTT